MYVCIKVADKQDALMVRDMLGRFEHPFFSSSTTLEEDAGWWFANAHASKSAVEKVLTWASQNEVKIFSIVTSSGDVFYEAKS